MLTSLENSTDQIKVEGKAAANILVLMPGEGINRKNVIRDLVYGSWCNGRRIGGTQMPPVNHLYVATMLKEDGHQVQFIDAQVDYASYQELEKKKFANLDFLILMSSTNSHRDDLKTVDRVKKLNPSVKVILFGSHPTFMASSCLEDKLIDFVILREPEMTIKDLVRKVVNGEELEGLPGCGYKTGKGPLVNEFDGHFDINQLPIPDWALLPKNVDYFNPVVKRMSLCHYADFQRMPG